MTEPYIITIFGSSRCKAGDDLYENSRIVGGELAKGGFVICNGGYGGTMEASARGVFEDGGRSIGVTSEVFISKVNSYISEEVRVPTHAARLMKLLSFASGFLVLPGGAGTILEAAAAIEYQSKGLMRKKPILFFGEFWNPFFRLYDNVSTLEGTIQISGMLHVTRETSGVRPFFTEYFSSDQRER